MTYKFLQEDEAAGKEIGALLTAGDDRDSAAIGELIGMVVLLPLLALAITAIGTWWFEIDRMQQVYVFCASSISLAIGSNVSVNGPERHIALALKAIAIAQYRKSQK